MNTLYSSMRIVTAAFLVATVLLAGCAGTSASAGATASPYARCVGQANADCFGGPP